MAIYLNKIVAPNNHLGVWKIEEDASMLLSKLMLNNEETLLYNSFKTDTRKLHWLSYRLLFKEMTNGSLSIFYDNHGKPIVSANEMYLSVSHSGKYSAIITNKYEPSGIDIEKMDDKILRIHHKFVTEKDYQASLGTNQIEKLYIHWCAKEALYKAYGKGLLDFKKQIFIEPFEFNLKGVIFGSYLVNGQLNAYKLWYEKLDDYMLVYTLEKQH